MRYLVTFVLLSGLMASLAAGQEAELIWREGKWVRQAPPAKGTPAGELSIIRSDVDRGHYRPAVRHAKKFLKRYPSSPLREEVLLLAGDAELHRGRYWQAYGWYDKVLDIPGAASEDRALERQMEVAQAFLSGKKRRLWGFIPLSAEESGIEILTKVAQHSPAAARAEMALLAIGDYYFEKGRYDDAGASYEGFIKQYPNSPRTVHAELRLAESLWRSYRGPWWDEATLIEAEQRYRAFAAARPAAARRANVEEILKEIHSARARKQYEVGQFYVRTDKPDGAGYYFRMVIEDYADTPWAARARSELGRLPQAPGREQPPQAAAGGQAQASQAKKESEK